MVRPTIPAATLLLLCFGLATEQPCGAQPLWEADFHRSSSGEGEAIATDPAGNVYVAGRFAGGLDLDGGSPSNIHAESGIFLASYDSLGNVRWLRSAACSGRCSALDVAVGPSARLYLLGFYEGGLDFDGDGVFEFVAVNGRSAFIARFDADGALEWLKGTDVSWRSAAVDSTGSMFLVGGFTGSVDVDADGDVDGTSRGDEDIVLAKYDNSFGLDWVRTAGGPGSDVGIGVGISTGYVQVVSTSSGTADFDSDNASDVDSAGVVIAKYDTSGVLDWVRTVLPGVQSVAADVVDGQGNSHIAGSVTWDDFLIPTLSTTFFVAFYDSVGSLRWIEGEGTGSHTSFGASDVAVDQEGNSYVTGSHWFVDSETIFLASYDTTGAQRWLNVPTGSAGVLDADQSASVAVDASGAVYITGSFMGWTDFDDDGALEAHRVGSQDFYLAKFKRNGDLQWVRSGGVYSIDYAADLAVDSAGVAHVVGAFAGQVDLDRDGTIDLSSRWPGSVFLAAYDRSGTLNSAKDVAGLSAVYTLASNGFNPPTYEVVFLETGRAYVVGSVDDAVDFDGDGAIDFGTPDDRINHDQPRSLFILYLEAGGHARWARGVDVSGELVDAASDADGNLYVAGRFEGDGDFDSDGTVDLTASSTDLFLASYDSVGAMRWVTSAPAQPVDIAFGTSRVYVSGQVYGQVDFDGDGIVDVSNAGFSDVFLAAYGLDGQFGWVGTLGGPERDFGGYMGVGPFGDVYVVGSTDGILEFDGEHRSDLSSSGSRDVFAAKYDANGNPRWIRRAGGPGFDMATSVDLDEFGAVYAAGSFSGSIDLDGDRSADLTSTGSAGIFVAKYSAGGEFIDAMSAGGSGTDLNMDPSGGFHLLINPRDRGTRLIYYPPSALSTGIQASPIPFSNASLDSPYPNPFNNETHLRFSVLRTQAVRLVLYNVIGQPVRVLYEGLVSAGNTVSIRIEGFGLASETYFVRLEGEDATLTRALTRLK